MPFGPPNTRGYAWGIFISVGLATTLETLI
ncbi:hypothetical protein SAMN05444159_7293 [Bradyrhizobium lablabi]|uniref:Uncharacterized protein n=1 Tax=Bradyrhizobium lablabi TaxID=722472 RepID=A0A1M7EVJ2_9BRAD|nr:hypothetical protein SAMN05444159_7293 [Bradyrhizobium lablabi]